MADTDDIDIMLSEDGLLSPYARSNLVGHKGIERELRQQIHNKTLHHGWIISGAPGIGKASLAARIMRAALDPSQLIDEETLEMDERSQIFRQIASMAHPDVFIARREWDDKKERYENEISVEKIRKLSQFLTHTASNGGARIAIIDNANDLNRNGANALLKVLEEPPENTLLLLLAHTPGKLLATIRSRCRMINLRPVPDEQVFNFLKKEANRTDEEVKLAVRAAQGAPGYGLKLIALDGLTALADAEKFISLAKEGSDFSSLAARFTGKGNETRWPIFKDHLLASLSIEARTLALNNEVGEVLGHPQKARLLIEAWESLSQLCAKGEGLNLDRGSLIEAMGYDLAQIFRRSAL